MCVYGSFALSNKSTIIDDDIISIENLPTNQEKIQTAFQYIEEAKILYQNHQYDSSFYLLNLVEKINKPIQSPQLNASLYYAKGRAHYFKNQHKKAVENYGIAVQFQNEIKDTAGLAKTYNAMGVSMKHRGEYYEAVKALNRSLEFYHYIRDNKGIALVELNMGNILKKLGKTKQAKQKYLNALNVFRVLNMEANQASCLNNLGNLYKNEKNYDSAYYYLSRTVEMREKLDDEILLSFAYHNMANLYSRMHVFDSALFYIDASHTIKSKYDNPLHLAGDYTTYGSIYAKMENWEQAIYFYQRCFDIEDSVGYIENKMEVAKDLATVYYENENYRQSAEKYYLYFELFDSLSSGKKSSLLQNELSQYEYFTDSIKNEQIRLKKELELAQNEKTKIETDSNEKRLYYMLVILVLLFLMIVYFLISTRKRLTRTNEYRAVLQMQNEELRQTLISKEEKEILLKEIHHRVKNNLQIINSLIRLQSNFMNEGNFQEKLMETENRIRSMGLIHEKLYKGSDLARLSIHSYLEELSINILESYENHIKISFKFDVAQQQLGIDSLISLGLIINEILSNSLKYAFFDREEGSISLQLYSEGDQSILKVWDDGIGADLSPEELREDSLGMDLIWSLTDQLDGTVSLDTTKGFFYDFKFPLLK
ncbi:MAG: tetratricopeptide repeat protein [Flavobacteriales bacterium]|nr:tetratricopeptide repeat protein [Flavobacteriales bacterium]